MSAARCDEENTASTSSDPPSGSATTAPTSAPMPM
jgi:hypothetical protein